MKRQDEDRLIELAFEELSPEETQLLRGQLANDPSQAGKLKAYAEMREGLASLRDVPEMQMSCDRLRDAILAGGLKEPRGNGWTWFAIPVAVAAGAFLFTIANRRPQASILPNIPVATTTVPGASFDVAMGQPSSRGLESIRPEAATTPLGNVEFNIPAQPVASKNEPRKPAVRVARETTRRPDEAVTKVLSGPEPAVAESPKMSLTSETPSGLAKEKDERPNTASVIVITPDQNGDTGTQRATEVESASNVVIGG